MSGIGNKISFNSTPYEVDKTNSTTRQASVRQSFAEKLQKASEDKNISADELNELKQMAQNGTASEQAIVMKLSTAGTAAFDPDSEGPMPPVEIKFGTPGANQTQDKPSTPPVTNTQATTPPPPKYTDPTSPVQVGLPGRMREFQASERMADFLAQASQTGKGIGYEEFQHMAQIAKETGCPDDVKLIARLTDAAISQKDDKKATFSMKFPEDDKPRNIRINDTPPPEGRGGANGGWGGFLNNFINTTVPGLVGEWATGVIRDELKLPPGSGTPSTGTTSTTSTTLGSLLGSKQ